MYNDIVEQHHSTSTCNRFCYIVGLSVNDPLPPVQVYEF